MIKQLLIYTAVLLLCLRSWGEQPTSTQIDELKSKALSFERAFQQKRTELGYSNLPPIQPDNVRIVVQPDVSYEENTIELRGDNYWIEFLKDSGKFLGFTDCKITAKQFGKESPTFSTRNKPIWSPEKAIAQAQPFFKAFLDDKAVYFSTPLAKYEYTMPDKEGFWEVFWPRIDSKGHSFEYDEGVSVRVSESAGPYGMGINLVAHFEEPTGEPLKQADVQDKALGVAKKTLTWGPVKGMLDPGHLDPKPFIAQLKVVKPNHLLDYDQINIHPDINARLAWVFWYAWRLDNNSNQIQSVSVWIDAYTGEILGGDAAMN